MLFQGKHSLISFLLNFLCISHLSSHISAAYNYGEALKKSLLFYEAQRSGKLPETNRVRWRSSALMHDKGSNGENLSGGYFNGGDYMKFGFPLASMTTVMGWGILDYRAGYEKAEQLNYALAALKWSTDYLIHAHPEPNTLYVQVGHPEEDHAYWGRPENYPNTVSRPVYKINATHPGSDVAAETAAALAVAYMVFNTSGDFAYAAKCLEHSKQLYTFATRHRGRYSDSVPNVQPYYKSWTGYGDELGWAAAWLYRATMSPMYLSDVEAHWTTYGLDEIPSEFSWDWKTVGMQVLMAKLTGAEKYRKPVQDFCIWAQMEAPRSPKGLIFISHWGTLGHAANIAFICLQASTVPSIGEIGKYFLDLGKFQIDYMLGDGGRSYVVGFGTNPPKKPKHAASSCLAPPAACSWKDFTKKDPNPQTLNGALVGGPGRKDTFEDKRKDAEKNDVGITFNAGFQSALAALIQLGPIKPLTP